MSARSLGRLCSKRDMYSCAISAIGQLISRTVNWPVTGHDDSRPTAIIDDCVSIAP